MTLTSFLTGIADKLRLYLGGDKIPAQSFADKIDNVYKSGQKTEYDKFWDEFQTTTSDINNDWKLRFAGRGWNDNTFRPKNDIIPTGNTYGLFWMSDITDLKGVLKKCGVELDLSQSPTTNMTMYSCRNLTTLPEINVSSSKHIGYLFGDCFKLKSIDKVVFSETNTTNGSEHATTGPSPFHNCSALENVLFEGILACNGVDLHWSTKLSHDSIVSVIEALSATTSGLTVTLSLQAVNKAFETAVGLADGSLSDSWNSLVSSKSNWTISLI